jgi:hypothetical protein
LAKLPSMGLVLARLPAPLSPQLAPLSMLWPWSVRDPEVKQLAPLGELPPAMIVLWTSVSLAGPVQIEPPSLVAVF